MIPNYTAPQPTISQFLEVVSPLSGDRQNLLVVGTNYQLQHYASGSTGGVAYTGSETVLPLAGIVPDAALDADYTKVFGEEVLVEAASIPGAGGLHFAPKDLQDDDTVFLFSDAGNTTEAVLSGAGLHANFGGRNVKVGDTLAMRETVGGAVVYRKVLGLVGKAIPSSHGTLSPASVPFNKATTTLTKVQGNLAATITGTFLDNARRPMFNGYLGDRITVVITTPGGTGVAKASVRSASGFYDGVNVSLTTAGAGLALSTNFSGVTVNITGSTVTLGDVIVFDLRGAYEQMVDHVVTGTYTGTVDTNYIIRVKTGGVAGVATATISDTAGLVVPYVVTLGATAIALGTQGLSFVMDDPSTFPQAGFSVGDIYVVSAKAATTSTEVFTGVKLDGPAYDLYSGDYSVPTDVQVGAEVLVRADGEISAFDSADTTLNFVTEAQAGNGIRVRAGLQTRIPGTSTFGKVVSANLFAKARGLVAPVQGETYFAVASSSDILATFGEIHPDNPLAWALNAGLGSAGKTCYGLRAAGESGDAYAAALSKTLIQDIFYAITTTADASKVLPQLKAHLSTTASSTSMKWRQGFLPVTTPESYAVHGVAAQANATVVAIGSSYVRLRDPEANFNTLNLLKGDEVRLNFGVDAWGKQTFESYKVDVVVSNTEIRLQSGPSAPIPVASKYEIHKPGTPANVVPYLQQLAQSAAFRRLHLVWVDAPRQVNAGINGGTQEVYAVAAEVAGLRAAGAPHQGLTKTVVSSVAAAPTMYALYTQEQLNAIAAAGVLIVTQDKLGGEVFIRHQLTTDTNNGPLYYESSCTSNLDSLDYSVKDIINKYIGRWNATLRTVQMVKDDIMQVLLNATTAQYGDQLGPQIAGFDDTFGNAGRIFIQINPIHKDRITVKFRVQIPLPLNGVDVYTFAITLDVNGNIIESTISA